MPGLLQFPSGNSFPADLDSVKPGLLPAGFPQSISTQSDLVWTGEDMKDESKYIYYFTNSDKEEIDAALEHFKDLDLDGDFVERDNFPLPRLQLVLRKLSLKIHNGQGFYILRGLDLSKYTVGDGMIIFLGIQSYIAEQRARQDDIGNVIVHVTPDSTPSTEVTRACHWRHSTSGISFHNDHNGDVLAWQTRNRASTGGGSIFASTHAIYNELASTRPDVIHTLSQPNWPFLIPHYRLRPILFHHNSRLIINYNRIGLLGSTAHPRPSSVPSLSPRQLEALDLLDELAEKNHLRFVTEAGDLHFMNNLTVLHRREAFDMSEDERERGRKRHLVRLYLRNRELGWELPGVLEEEWNQAFEGEGERVYHIQPMPEGFFPLRKWPM